MTINEASAQTPAAAPAAVPAFAGNHQVKPLRFNPARLHGLSERLITSHHENNYAGSVKALNMIETRSEEHTSELQSLMRISYAVFCLTTKNSLSSSRENWITRIL